MLTAFLCACGGAAAGRGVVATARSPYAAMPIPSEVGDDDVPPPPAGAEHAAIDTPADEPAPEILPTEDPAEPAAPATP